MISTVFYDQFLFFLWSFIQDFPQSIQYQYRNLHLDFLSPLCSQSPKRLRYPYLCLFQFLVYFDTLSLLFYLWELSQYFINLFENIITFEIRCTEIQLLLSDIHADDTCLIVNHAFI